MPCYSCDEKEAGLCRECYREDMEETRQRAEKAEYELAELHLESWRLRERGEALAKALKPFALLDTSNDPGTEAWDAMIINGRAALAAWNAAKSNAEK